MVCHWNGLREQVGVVFHWNGLREQVGVICHWNGKCMWFSIGICMAIWEWGRSRLRLCMHVTCMPIYGGEVL